MGRVFHALTLKEWKFHVWVPMARVATCALQETTLTVEYIPAVVPPKHQQSTPHDDW